MHKCGDLNMKLNDLICNSHSFFFNALLSFLFLFKECYIYEL